MIVKGKSGLLSFQWIIYISIGFVFLGSNCLADEDRFLQKDSQDILAHWQKITQKGRIELWVQPGSGLVRIMDRRIHLLWKEDFLAGHVQANYQTTADYWKTAYQSAFIIRYLNDSGNPETAFTGQSDCRKQFKPCPSGAIFTFHFPDCQIRFEAIYTLGPDNNLQITIPFHKILDRKKRLLDIRVLPYFGPLENKSRNTRTPHYLVVPDGCGGIVKATHYPQDYNPVRIYGERLVWNSRLDNRQSTRVLQLADYTNPQNSFITLPIFGVVKENGAFLGVISQGQFQAELGVEVTPITLRPAISTRLLFREITYDILGQLHSSPIFDRRDRIINYFFMVDKDASYLGIARKYREILLSSMGRPQTTTTAVQTDFRLRLFMGVNEQYLDTSRLIRLTSFQQAETILKDLHHRGIRHIQVIMVGWSNQGYLGDNPRHFPPDKRLGGARGLKQLISTAKKLGISLGLQFDNSYAFRKSHGFRRSNTVKDIQDVPIDIGFGRKEYLYCPKPAWKTFLKKDFQTIHDYKIEGFLLFDGINQGLFNCYDRKNHPVSYKSTATLIRDSFQMISKTNPIAVTSSMDFSYPYTAALYDLPAQTSNNCDESIPLIPIICHGWLPYSFTPINERNDSQWDFLKSIEYGAIPNAYLTMKSVDELIYTKYNPLISGKYTDWRPKLTQEYRIYEKDLRALQNRTIVDHQNLAKEVYLTVYDNGTRIIVNYSLNIYFYGGKTVPAQNYIIMR